MAGGTPANPATLAIASTRTFSVNAAGFGLVPEWDPLKPSSTLAPTKMTRRSGPDANGVGTMTRIAADENLHMVFYRDIMTAALIVQPSAAVREEDEGHV